MIPERHLFSRNQSTIVTCFFKNPENQTQEIKCHTKKMIHGEPNLTADGQKSSGSTHSPLLISMLGIIVTSVALVAYHFFLIMYCMRRHNTNNTRTAAQPTNVANPPTGVDQKLLETIPIFTFVKRDMDEDECVVCLGELEDEDMVRLLPNCNHAFHVSCIDQWFEAHTSCPLCRSPIVEQTSVEPSLDAHGANDSDPEIGESSAPRNSIRETSPRAQSYHLLPHCVSLILPPQLKRSLSMDESFIVIDIHNVNYPSPPLSSSSRGLLTRTMSGSHITGSMSHFDRVSSKWLRSLPRLGVNKGSNGPILPY